LSRIVIYTIFTERVMVKTSSRDHNLRDQDLLKISIRDRDVIKNSETEIETRDFKICAFCQKFL